MCMKEIEHCDKYASHSDHLYSTCEKCEPEYASDTLRRNCIHMPPKCLEADPESVKFYPKCLKCAKGYEVNSDESKCLLKIDNCVN